MTSTATFMTEFHSSMTFEYKAEMDVSQADILSKMPPRLHSRNHQVQGLLKEQKSPDHLERSSDIHHSPCSSRGTSLASSPALPVETVPIPNNGLSQNFQIRDLNMSYPSSDDSGSIINDMSGYNGEHDEMPSPLAQLQCALEKNGMLGKKLDLSPYSVADSDLLQRQQESTQNASDDCIEIFKCHLCSYSSSSKAHFNSHMNSHFDHKCPFCDYTSRTEGRLKRHVKDFHSETPPESWAGSRIPRNDASGSELSMDDSVSSTGNNKSRTYRCKQCGFVAYRKNDFWEHNKIHIKAEKLLTCPQCAFVTEYKHHLEYHIRNHFGSKPFKCGKCNYSCVNKSMLNSHMKSHSNIYQYRCANCSYATKYCHSLKLHLRKYEHKPASVLNVDGSPNPFPVIDVYGSRRGPRPKKRKFLEEREGVLNPGALVSSQSSINYSAMSPMIPSNLQMMYPPHIFNGYHGSIFIRPQTNGESMHPQNNSHFGMKANTHLKCLLCEFTTDHQEAFHKHMILHAAKENQDLIKLYGINSESILQVQEQHSSNKSNNNNDNYSQSNSQRRENGVFKSETRDGMFCKDTTTNSQLMSNVCVDVPAPQERLKIEEVEEKNPCSKTRGYESVSPATSVSFAQISTDQLPCSSLTQHDGEETQQTPENRENTTSRSVIVSRKTPPSTPPTQKDEMNSEVHLKSSPTASQGEQVGSETAIPLDLSSTKGNDSLSPQSIIDQEEMSNSSAENNPANSTFETNAALFSNSISAASCFPGQSRNRRKGKAFKIDRYLQLEERSSPNVESDADQRRQQQQTNGNIFATEYVPEQSAAAQNASLAKLSRNLMQDTIDAPKFLNTPSLQSSLNKSSQIAEFERNSSEDTQLRESQYTLRSASSSNESNHIVSVPNPTDQDAALKKPLPNEVRPKPEVYNSATETPVKSCEGQSTITSKGDDAQSDGSKWKDAYMCTYCDMAFRDCVMYTMHMGYHGYADPFTCNMCGHVSKDKVEFFLHIARTAHK